MQDYNVLSRTPVGDSSDEGDSDDPDDRDRRSLLPRPQVKGHHQNVPTNSPKMVSSVTKSTVLVNTHNPLVLSHNQCRKTSSEEFSKTEDEQACDLGKKDSASSARFLHHFTSNRYSIMAQCVVGFRAFWGCFECYEIATHHHFCTKCFGNHAIDKSLDVCNRECCFELGYGCWCIAEHNIW